jgi:hypothetical protein
MMANLVVTLYSMTAIFFVLLFQRNWTNMIEIREQMRDAGMIWHAAVYSPPAIMVTWMWIGVFNMSSLFFGAVWFFILERRRDIE